MKAMKFRIVLGEFIGSRFLTERKHVGNLLEKRGAIVRRIGGGFGVAQENGGNRGGGRKTAENIGGGGAVHIGEHGVKNNQMRPTGAGATNRVETGARNRDVEAGELECDGKGLQNISPAG